MLWFAAQSSLQLTAHSSQPSPSQELPLAEKNRLKVSPSPGAACTKRPADGVDKGDSVASAAQPNFSLPQTCPSHSLSGAALGSPR